MKIGMFVVMLIVGSFVRSEAGELYGVARSSTPVLHTAAFSSVFGGHDGRSLKTDACGQVRELEFIALPGSVFKIIGETKDRNATIFQVTTEEYSASRGTQLYVDRRFLMMSNEQPLRRAVRQPEQEAVLTSLKRAVGKRYVWGGNVSQGVEMLSETYFGGVAGENAAKNILAGLDCSGLLYQATGGWTPRNTSQLVSFGTAVAIAGKTPKQITKLLKPLDLIVWNGHVLIVLDADNVIESRLDCNKKDTGGVVITGLSQRLEEIMRSRRPVDSWPGAAAGRSTFVVRRWL